MTVTLEGPPRRRELQHERSGEGEKRSSLRRIFAIGVAAAAAVALLVVALGAFSLWRLTDARAQLLDVGGPSTIASNKLVTALVDQETAVRGYLLAGNDRNFLGPYEDGLADEQANLEVLYRLTGAPGQKNLRADVDAVVTAAQAWRAAYADPLTTPGAAGPTPEQGRAEFDRVRAALDQLSTDLGVQQQRLRAGLNDAATSLLVVGIAIVVLLAGFLVAAGIGLRRQVLDPVARLAGEVREVVSGDVHREVMAEGPREILQLGEDVEAMRRHILADLSDVQAVNQRLDEQARDLERSNRDLEQFAYVASHDLQEPLRKVSSFCQLLQRRYGGQLDERADQYIEFAVDGAQRMQRLINDLLAFSRVGRTTDGFEEVDLNAVATSAVNQLDSAREQVDGELVVGELPTVIGDRGLLLQLFTNLLGNGLKFHREGVPPVVEVGAVRVDDAWEITVSDNGIGIEPEYAEKVFVIFQRLHGRDRYAGTGIGLALAKKIVEFHGGRIGLGEPAPGEPGAAIRLTLPAVPADEEGSPLTDPTPRIINVLLVEDDPGDVLMTREAFDEYLHNRLDVVTDGADALSYLRQEGQYSDVPRPDLILLDLNLPKRDGREVLQEVKDDPHLRHIPVIVLTTSQAEEDVLRSYQLHANAYVTKPVDFEGFIEAIKQIDHFFVSVVQLPPGQNPA